MSKIFTLNVRGNILFDVLQMSFQLNPAQMHEEIIRMHRVTLKVLDGKGVNYTRLKSALTPQPDRHEAGFLFQANKIESMFYGHEVMKNVLPLLDKTTSQSILVGDLLGSNQNAIYGILKKYLVSSRSFEFTCSNDIYCVYINNLSKKMLKTIHEGLLQFYPYIGFLPTTYSTPAKAYLSTTALVNSCVKNGLQIIMGHEDDRSNMENENLGAPAYNMFGYNVLSLQSSYFDNFLSFKIESAVANRHEIDVIFSINAISKNVLPIFDFKVLLEEKKYEYLLKEKSGKLQKAGIIHLNRNQLISLIEDKIQSNYIYNLEYLSEHDVVKFNTMVEIGRDNGHPTKLTVALEYIAKETTLRVITIY